LGGGATDAWAQQTVRVLRVRMEWCVQGCGLWVGEVGGWVSHTGGGGSSKRAACVQ